MVDFRSEADPGSQAIGREASMNVPQDLEGLVVLTAAVEHRGKLDGCICSPWIKL